MIIDRCNQNMHVIWHHARACSRYLAPSNATMMPLTLAQLHLRKECLPIPASEKKKKKAQFIFCVPWQDFSGILQFNSPATRTCLGLGISRAKKIARELASSQCEIAPAMPFTCRLQRRHRQFVSRFRRGADLSSVFSMRQPQRFKGGRDVHAPATKNVRAAFRGLLANAGSAHGQSVRFTRHCPTTITRSARWAPQWTEGGDGSDARRASSSSVNSAKSASGRHGWRCLAAEQRASPRWPAQAIARETFSAPWEGG